MKKFCKILKATIISLIVAFLFVITILCVIYQYSKSKIEMAMLLIDTITVKEESTQEISPVLENGIIINYPSIGTKYAVMKIESIGVELPVYYGASYSILKSGIAHDDTSFFPGQGGSVIMAGHNFKNFLAKLPDTKIGDIICLETTYGTFNYKITKQKVIKETAVDEVPVQKEKEVLMLYTCWPINNIGHASERYIVYADLEK